MDKAIFADVLFACVVFVEVIFGQIAKFESRRLFK